MIRKEDPIERVRRAHSLVLRAVSCWHAGDIAAVEESLAALNESGTQLRAVQTEVCDPVNSLTGSRNLTGVRNEILQMRGEVARMESLSNIAARFLGGGTESSDDSPLYGAGGLAETNPSPGLRTIFQA